MLNKQHLPLQIHPQKSDKGLPKEWAPHFPPWETESNSQKGALFPIGPPLGAVLPLFLPETLPIFWKELSF